MEDFNRIVPLGNLAPAAHTLPTVHHYIDIRKTDPNDPTSLPVEVPVVSPADITITEMTFIEELNRPDFTDYSLIFEPCLGFKSYLDHFLTVAPVVQKAYDAAPVRFCRDYTLYYEERTLDWRLCKKEVNIEIKAGEPLGTAGGGEGQNALDFAAFDFRQGPSVFANPDRWVYQRDMTYAVCPLDYFPAELKDQLKSRLGPRHNGPLRTAEPICGEVAQDIPGTAQGIWIEPGLGIEWDESQIVALVHDNFEPSLAVFSIGLSMEDEGLAHGAYYFDPVPSGLVNRDFGDIVPGDTYCFEGLSGRGDLSGLIILIALTDPATMMIEGQPRSSCGTAWDFVSPTQFER
ncbi:MAG: hypothetical protein BZY87_04835 [SAR202 cluster bacterium Io17-Chloro-G6]|nr:MAG: hypothetical protein BZY87_04835 [SAR202 cluster bacterium Io17-Chloro-G6]